MKKNLLVLGMVAVMSLGTAMTAHADFVVAPTEEEQIGIDTGTVAGYKWYIAEEQRQKDRLISNNAPRINQISDPVQRLAEVVKAVANYGDTYDYNLACDDIYQWKTSCFDYYTMAKYTYILGRECGLDISVKGMHTLDEYNMAVETCNINGVTYWADAYTYDRTGDVSLLGTTVQPSYVLTQEQYEAKCRAEWEAIPEELRNMQYDSNGVYVGGMF